MQIFVLLALPGFGVANHTCKHFLGISSFRCAHSGIPIPACQADRQANFGHVINF
jgi:hypothetical protein